MLMRALKHTVTEEGEILPGDLFYPGYFHNRDTSIFSQDNPIAWTTPEIRAHQLMTDGLAERLPCVSDLKDLEEEQASQPAEPSIPELQVEADPVTLTIELAEPANHEE